MMESRGSPTALDLQHLPASLPAPIYNGGLTEAIESLHNPEKADVNLCEG